MIAAFLILLLFVVLVLLVIVIILKKQNSALKDKITNLNKENLDLNNATMELKSNLEKGIDALLETEKFDKNQKNTITILQLRNTKLKLENDKLKSQISQTEGMNETTNR